MIDAKEARKVRDQSGKLSFDKRCPCVVKYVEDAIKYGEMVGASEVVLKFSKKLLLTEPEMKIVDLIEFLRSKGYLVDFINDSREDVGPLVISW